LYSWSHVVLVGPEIWTSSTKVRLILSVGIAVRMGMVRSHVPTQPTCELLQSTHICWQKLSWFSGWKAIQELWVKNGLSFLVAQKKFLENKPKTGTQSYTPALHHPQVTDATLQTTALLNQGYTSKLPQTTVSTLRSPCRLKASQPPPCQMLRYGRVSTQHFMSDTLRY
jgi:hypothetical protein